MEHPIGNLMDTTMNKIKEMVDVNTIVGEPITAPDGTLIIPVSKVTYGFAAGGSDLPTKKENKDCFGGGSGAGGIERCEEKRGRGEEGRRVCFQTQKGISACGRDRSAAGHAAGAAAILFLYFRWRRVQHRRVLLSLRRSRPAGGGGRLLCDGG